MPDQPVAAPDSPAAPGGPPGAAPAAPAASGGTAPATSGGNAPAARASDAQPASRRGAGRLNDPEQLDAMLTLTGPLGWLALATVGFLVFCFVVWTVVGRIPLRAQGMGVVIRGDTVVFDVNAPSEGTVLAIHVAAGDTVEVGTPIAEVVYPGQEAKLAAQRDLLAKLEAQYARQQVFDAEDIAKRRSNTAKQVASLEKDIRAAHQLLGFLRSLYETQKKELAEGYIAKQQVESTLNNVHSTESKLRSSEVQIRDLQLQQKQFENQKQVDLENLQHQIIQTRGDVESMQAQLLTDKHVLSPIAGTVSEVSVNRGERIGAGQQLVLIEQRGEGLELVAYFKNADGKKVLPDMAAQVSPLFVERDLYGTVNAKVERVSSLPQTRAALLKRLGNDALVGQLMEEGAPIEARIHLVPDAHTYSGLSWTSSVGPPAKVTPGTLSAVSVEVRQERPINLLLPIWNTWVR